MASSVSPERRVSFSPEMDEMVTTQRYNPEDLVSFVVRFDAIDLEGAKAEFKLKSILKISESPSPIDHEMLEIIKKVESAVEEVPELRSGAKTRNSVDTLQRRPQAASFKPTETTLTALCEEEEI